MSWSEMLNGLAARLGLLFSALLATLAASVAVHAQDMKNSRPNVILILMDDLGYSDIGSYGGEIPTPTIDELAAKGVHFRQFYNSAKCEPTRASLMAGQYWTDTGLGVRRGATLGQVLQPADYRTYALGKWHMRGNPVDRGFNRYFGHLSGATDFFNGNPSFRLNAERFIPGDDFYATVAYTDHAIDFIREGKELEPEKPFFMYMAQTAPHAPLQALPEDIALFEDMYRRGWDIMHAERVARMRERGLVDAAWPIPARPDTVPAWDSLTPVNKEFEINRMAVLAAMVYRVDLEIKRLLDALEEMGERENTLVIFMSDNGASPYDWVRRGEISEPGSYFDNGLGWAWMRSAPYRYYKRNQHQGGIATPFIAHWPAGIPADRYGAQIDTPQHIIDILPTLMELSGAEYPRTFNGDKMPAPPGQSLLPRFRGETDNVHEVLYFQLFNHWAIIKDGMKLASAWGREAELFDLTADRAEVNDLSEEMPDLRKKLTKDWQRWASNTRTRIKDSGGEPEWSPFPRQRDVIPRDERN